MAIKVGDKVVWRSGMATNKPSIKPMGIANCEVIELGKTADGLPAAKLKLPPGPWPVETVNALVDDLETER
jgi:hypothetical protein